MEGWIRLHRKLSDNDLWTCEPFSKGQAWVDLLLIANYEDGYFYKRGVKVNIKRGQVGWSELSLSNRWKWSRNKVRKFLLDLEKEQQIEQQKTNVTQIVTIINYDEYQKKGQQKDTKRTTEGHQKDTNNKNKEEKKENNKYIPSFEEFKNHALLKEPLVNLNALKNKYDSWIENDWKDGRNNKIINWKSKLTNTITFIPKDDKYHSGLQGNDLPSHLKGMHL